MSKIRGLSCTLIIFLFLVCAVMAVVPDGTSPGMSSSKPDGWFIANGADSGTITIDIRNNSTPINGAQVAFSVNNSLLGAVIPDSIFTINGMAATTFSSLKKSGDVKINASVRYKVNDTDMNEPYKYRNYSLLQQIDHDTPYRIDTYNFTNEMNVATSNPIKLGFTDRWGNKVDNRRAAEEVEFSVSSPSPYNAGFWSNGSWVSEIWVPVDSSGIFNVDFKVCSNPGWNIVLVHPLMETPDHLQAVEDKYLWIEGLPGVPWSIETTIEPANNETYADGLSRFHFRYLVKDQFGNPVMNRSLNIGTSIPGENLIIGTNSQGLAMMYYGPKSSIGMVWVNATSLDNTSVQSHRQVWFVSQEAANLELSANPQIMPSVDANPGFTSQIIAKVTDILGNPVRNVTVTFGNGSISYDKTNYTITSQPSLSATNAVTNENGYAIVYFTPGGFSTNFSDPKYQPTITGRCTVSATWNSTTRDVPVVWKNYPYLSAETYTSKSQVQVGDTVDVTVMLKGDGWALQPKPADIVLVTDLAGGVGGGQLLSYTKTADIAFVNNATNSTWVGLVSFGNNPQPYSTNASLLYTQQENTTPRSILFNPYANVWDWCLESPALWDSRSQSPSAIINTPAAPRAQHYLWSISTGYNYFNSYSDATVDSPLTAHASKSTLISKINGYNAKGGTDYAAGINAAIQVLDASGYSGHAKAIIIMGDGIPMMAPISPGSLESYWPSDWYPRSNLGWEDESDIAIEAAVDAARRAEAHGITVYAAGFPLNNQVDNATLLRMVTSPDCYYFTPDPSKLDQLLLTIQGRIQKEAGVNTSMGLQYDQVEVNATPMDNSGSDPTLDYVYVPGASSLLNSYYTNGSTPAHTPSYPYTYDQTSDWHGNPRKLSFSVGTILLNQVWVGQYRLKVGNVGSLGIFGPGSIINFDGTNGPSSLTLPQISITGLVNQTDTNVTTNILDYTTLSQDPNSDDPESKLFITFRINSTYTGTMTLTENYYIITHDQHKYLVGTRILTPEEANHERTFRMRIADLPPGWEYFLPVVNVMDAPGPERPTNPPAIQPPPSTAGHLYIILK
jgi:hypothetical protein